MTEHSAKVAVCKLVLGKKRPLTLGYYVVRSRGADSDDNFDHVFEEQMFRNEPWSGWANSWVRSRAEGSLAYGKM